MIEMSAIELQQYLTSDNTTPLLIDVRENWEFQHCHIQNSVLIPMADIMQQYQQLEKDRETVIICHHGIRSRQVARFLESQGFSKLINLSGGVAEWANDVDSTMQRY